MERLTDNTNYCSSWSDCEMVEGKCVFYGNCYDRKIYNKLKYYEDLEEQGLLMKLPCKVGDTVYVVKYLDEGYIVEAKVDSFKTRKDAILAYDKFDKFIGCLAGGLERRAFLTKAEAEKALAEMEK